MIAIILEREDIKIVKWFCLTNTQTHVFKMRIKLFALKKKITHDLLRALRMNGLVWLNFKIIGNTFWNVI